MIQVSDDLVFVYQIDGNDKITFVDEAWLLFARQNDAPELTRETVLGHILWKFIGDATTVEIYKRLLNRVRATQLPVTVPFRCDSSTRCRYMEMEMVSLGNGVVQFNSRILTLEERAEVKLLSSRIDRSAEVVNMCSWCKKIKTAPGCWVEVEEATREMNLFHTIFPPMISHGICPDCLESLQSQLVELGTTLE
ncbi:MAG: hypothetical protein D6768_08605 [Chloroflexi bacterium]|nr:MAG: hypothetical protein D6768_08605 [Chloroflexota bacterium]